jgi:hypothetical protein
MCWSYEASLYTGLFTYITGAIAYNRNQGYDRWLAMFILSFGTIQFLEAFLWKNIDKNNDVNYYITKYAIPFILASEGLVALYGASLHKKISDDMFVIYIICAFLIFTIGTQNSKYTTISSTGNLTWGNISAHNYTGILFIIYLLLPFWLYMEDEKMRIVVITGCIMTYIYSVFVYKESWGSNWCFFANSLSAIVLLRPYL